VSKVALKGPKVGVLGDAHGQVLLCRQQPEDARHVLDGLPESLSISLPTPNPQQAEGAALDGPLSDLRTRRPTAWAVSRRLRNRARHALHGNGAPSQGRSRPPGGRDGGWLLKLSPRELQEVQTVGKLRAAGWSISSDIAAEEVLRVYDTRLEKDRLTRLLRELHPALKTEHLAVVGGNLLTKPTKDDAVLGGPLQRWGPSGQAAYHIVVPPRPHLQRWLDRYHQ
jgi:hypothetical protein